VDMGGREVVEGEAAGVVVGVALVYDAREVLLESLSTGAVFFFFFPAVDGEEEEGRPESGVGEDAVDALASFFLFMSPFAVRREGEGEKKG
jgi:hypothetical protein